LACRAGLPRSNPRGGRSPPLTSCAILTPPRSITRAAARHSLHFRGPSAIHCRRGSLRIPPSPPREERVGERLPLTSARLRPEPQPVTIAAGSVPLLGERAGVRGTATSVCSAGFLGRSPPLTPAHIDQSSAAIPPPSPASSTLSAGPAKKTMLLQNIATPAPKRAPHFNPARSQAKNSPTTNAVPSFSKWTTSLASAQTAAASQNRNPNPNSQFRRKVRKPEEDEPQPVPRLPLRTRHSHLPPPDSPTYPSIPNAAYTFNLTMLLPLPFRRGEGGVRNPAVCLSTNSSCNSILNPPHAPILDSFSDGGPVLRSAFDEGGSRFPFHSLNLFNSV